MPRTHERTLAGRASRAARRGAALAALLIWATGPAVAAPPDSPAAVAAGERAGRPPSAPGDEPPYQNTWAKDIVMDAPWRVVDAATPIPILVALKDCGDDEIAALRWLRCRDVTGGAQVTLWLHGGGDERLGDDPDEEELCAWITTVTEGHPSLPDGTPLTPANLGDRAGDVIALEVAVRFRDNLLWDQTATRVLRVRVGGGPFPWPGSWYGGDLHAHTMLTNNTAEWGAPLPAMSLAAQAIGLQWVAATDHSCDLDETGVGAWSYATHAWRCTVQSPAGTQTVVRDVFAADGTAWGGLGAQIAELDSPRLRLARGVEINLASVDPATYSKTLHALFYDCGYVASPWSGAPGERPVAPTVPAGLDALAAGGIAFAAHPWDDLAHEWAGVDLGVNGAAWGGGDFTAALAREAFRGVQAFNPRATVTSSDIDKPWDEFAAGRPAATPYPGPLLTGIARWDSLVRVGLACSLPRRVLLAGGSDAHGDFNYGTRLALDDYADDNALGKVQTVVRVPGPWRLGALPPTTEILAALRAGRSIATDGPFLQIVLDRDRDGELYTPSDLGIGDAIRVNPGACPPLLLQWTSLPEFGPVMRVRVVAVTRTGTVELASFDPRPDWQDYAGVTDVALAGRGLLGPAAVRAELTTADGGAGHRAFTNPIWITFDPSVAVDPPAGGGDHERDGDGAGPDPSGSAPGLSLEPSAPNPAAPGTEVRFRLARPALVRLAVYDLAGRRVRSLIAGQRLPAGCHHARWDGSDDRGAMVASGAYAVRLDADGRRRGRLVQVLR